MTEQERAKYEAMKPKELVLLISERSYVLGMLGGRSSESAEMAREAMKILAAKLKAEGVEWE